jgi:hypothetical protein
VTVPSNGNGGKKKRELTPEAKEKLSRLAKQRHAEGKFGGSKFGRMGGRPPKDRAAKRVSDAAQEDANARAIIEVFKDAIHPNMPMTTRLKAVEAWLGVEREEAKVALQEEEVAGRQHSREELVAKLAESLTQGPTSTILRRQLEQETGIVDADVVEGTANEAA